MFEFFSKYFGFYNLSFPSLHIDKKKKKIKSKNIIFKPIQVIYNFFLYIEMTNNNCQKHKERLQKEAHEKYQSLSEKEKNKIAKKCSRKMLKFYCRRKRKKSSVSS